jgi:ABC-type sugar transport system permease subunit
MQNYWLAVNDPDVQEALLHTLQFAGEAIPMVLLFSLGIALVLNEAIPGGGFVKVIALLPWAVSDFATGIVWKWIWVDGFGFVNGVLINLHLVKGSTTLITGTSAMHQLALAEAWHIAPLGAFFLLAALQVIPEDLYRQSRVDGAGTWGRFRFVTFPFINYSMLITLVIATLFTMESLDEVLLLTGGGPGSVTQTLTYRIYQYSFVQFNLGYGAAVSYFLLVFIFILATAWFRLLQRRR